MSERPRCHKCGKFFTSGIEDSALKKLARMDYFKANELRLKRCYCSPKEIPVFTSRPHPRDLQWYDKFSV